MSGLGWLEGGEVQAAASLLATRGYGGVQAQELARAMGRSVGSMYRAYGNKAGVAQAVRSDTERELAWRGTCAWQVTDGAGESFRTPFLAVWDALANWAGEHPELFAFTYLHPCVEALGPDGASHTRGETQARALVLEVLETGRARGVLRASSPWLLAGVVWGALAELVRTSQACGRRLSNAEIAEAGEVLWCALRRTPAHAAAPAQGAVHGALVSSHPLHARLGRRAAQHVSLSAEGDGASGAARGASGDAVTPAGSDTDCADASTSPLDAFLQVVVPPADGPGARGAARPVEDGSPGGQDTLGAGWSGVEAGARGQHTAVGGLAAADVPAVEGRAAPRGGLAPAAAAAEGRATSRDGLAPADVAAEGRRSPDGTWPEDAAPAWAHDLFDGAHAEDDVSTRAPSERPRLHTVEEMLQRWPRGTDTERWLAQTAMDRGELTLELYLGWRRALLESWALEAQSPRPSALDAFRDMWDQPAWDDLDDPR